MGVVEVKIFFGSSGQTVTSMKKKKLIDYQEHPDLSTSLSYLTTLNSLTVITSLTTPYLLPWPAPTHNTTLINPTTLTTPATSDKLATLSNRNPSGSLEWERKITKDGIMSRGLSDQHVCHVRRAFLSLNSMPRPAQSCWEAWQVTHPSKRGWNMDQSSKTPSRCIYYKATNRQNPFSVRLPLICTGKGFWRFVAL